MTRWIAGPRCPMRYSGRAPVLLLCGALFATGFLYTPVASAGNWGERWGVLHWGVSPSPPAPPDAPVIVQIQAGFGELTVKFADGNDDGGSPVISYTVTCGGLSASGSSPVVVSGLDPYTEYQCTAVATNAEGDSLASAGVSGTPLALRRLNIPLIKAAVDALKP